MPLSSTFSTISSTQTDANSPLDTILMEAVRQDIHALFESIVGESGAYTLSTAHNHDGNNSRLVAGANFALISSAAPSAVAAVNFTGSTLFSTTYESFVFVMTGMRPDTNSAQLTMVVSTDGGSSYSTSGYKLAARRSLSAGGSADAISDGDNAMRFSGDMSTDSTGNAFCVAELFTPWNAAYPKHCRFACSYGNLGSQVGAARHEASDNVDAVSIRFDTGNILSGRIHLFGIRQV